MPPKSFSLHLVGLSALLSSSSFAAVTASFDFESETANDFFSDSVTGWSQDQSNPKLGPQGLSQAVLRILHGNVDPAFYAVFF